MADHTQTGGDHRRRGTISNGRRGAVTLVAAADQNPQPSSSTTSSTTSSSPPCGACKFLRRKCTSGCIFAPYFGTDQGAARFAAVHKVFGASNVSKLLTHIPTGRRHDAVVTISYEAQARLSDPVYGCVSTILALQQQVANLQAELSIVQSQLINSRLAVANALETSQHHQQHHHTSSAIGIFQQHHQPSYSNNSSASTTPHLIAGPAVDMSSCCFAASATNYDALPASVQAPSAAAPPPPPAAALSGGGHHLFVDPHLRLSRHDEDDDEEDSRAPQVAFANHVVR
ncbi:hypothetical protein V2J09_000203 [Rumex salicifolius]